MGGASGMDPGGARQGRPTRPDHTVGVNRPKPRSDGRREPHVRGNPALGGTAVAAAILLPGWLRGWMGAGDVKLMMALGAWLAWPAALLGTLASLIAGGVIAVLVALKHRALGRAVRGAAALATAPAGAVGPPHTGLRFPFATAIFAGSFLALWVRL